MQDAIKAAVDKLSKAGYKKAADELQLAWDKTQVEAFQMLPPNLPEEFTLTQLMAAWVEFTGKEAKWSDTFMRRAGKFIEGTGNKLKATHGKPAELYRVK